MLALKMCTHMPDTNRHWGHSSKVDTMSTLKELQVLGAGEENGVSSPPFF